VSKTGTYAYRDGKLVKVSDRVPSLRSPVYFPPRSKRSCGAYEEEHFGDKPVMVTSKDHKRQIMKEQHLAEVG
jgi:hypothetical protein